MNQIFFILLLQAASTDTASELPAQLDEFGNAHEELFDCMDRETRTSLKAHFSDASPELVVDEALSSCSLIVTKMEVRALETLNAVMTEEKAKKKAKELVQQSKARIRSAYTERIAEMLSNPAFSKARIDIILSEWGGCVRKKIAAWANQKENAQTIADAAIEACKNHQKNWKNALIYQLKNGELPKNAPTKIESEVIKNLRQRGIVWVLESRTRNAPD